MESYNKLSLLMIMVDLIIGEKFEQSRFNKTRMIKNFIKAKLKKSYDLTNIKKI